MNCFPPYFCVPGMALYLTGESPEGDQDSDKPIAKTKGVLREVESESRRRQASGPTNRNFVRRYSGG